MYMTVQTTLALIVTPLFPENRTIMLSVSFLLVKTADIGSSWPFGSLSNHPLVAVSVVVCFKHLFRISSIFFLAREL